MLAVFNTFEENGAIPFATATGLVSGDSANAVSTLGDGQFGQTTGDYDWFSLTARVDQTLEVEVFSARFGTFLDPVITIYDSDGTLLDSDDDSGPSLDPFLSFVPPANGTYFVALFDGSLGFQRDPFDPASGTSGFIFVGDYEVEFRLSARVNDAPVANDDFVTVNEDSSIAINMLSNDTDADGTLVASSVVIGTQPINGTLVLNATTGVATYTPAANFFGSDSFTYTVVDDEGLISNTATVDITIASVNDAPVALNDGATVARNVATSLNVTINDTDPDGTINPNTIRIVTNPLHGTASVVAGAILYTPTTNYTGLDRITYAVRDNGGLESNVATVNIQVISPPPNAVNDIATTQEDTPVTINVLANDSDPDGTIVPSTVAIATGPANGMVVVNASGSITYVPALNFFGSDTFSYTVRDNDNGQSNVATVSITVNPVNDPPVATNDSAQTNRGVAVVIDVLANDSDPDGTIDPGTVVIVTPPANGTTSINPTTGAITFTPGAAFGTITFQYQVRDDSNALSNVATVTVLVNDIPIAVDDVVTTLEDTPVSIDVSANDTDADGTIVPSSVAIVTQPTNGTVSIDPTTFEVLYTPNLNFFGSDSFQYTIRDNSGAVSDPGTVSITVISVNDPPVAEDDFASTDVDVAAVIDVLANDSDIDGTLDTGSIIIVTAPTSGNAVANPDGTITYTPNVGFAGADRLIYTVADDGGAVSNQATVLIRVGDPVRISGVVYADINNNGLQDSNEIGISGVTVVLNKTDGPVTFGLEILTHTDGTFIFEEVPDGGFILPAGVYDLVELHPGFFHDGKDTPGTPAPATVQNDAFLGITLGAAGEASNFRFGELGLRAEFVSAFVSRRAFFASATPSVTSLNLAQGAAWFSFNATAAPVTLQATADFAAAKGAVSLTFYDNNLKPLVSGSNSVQLQTAASTGYFLKVSGNNPDVDVLTTTISASTWRNATNPMDVNADGAVTALDALSVINMLNRQGSGALTGTHSGSYVDVSGDGHVTPTDALSVINWLNQTKSKSVAAPPAAAAMSVAGPVDSVSQTQAAPADSTALAPASQASTQKSAQINLAMAAALASDFSEPGIPALPLAESAAADSSLASSADRESGASGQASDAESDLYALLASQIIQTAASSDLVSGSAETESELGLSLEPDLDLWF